MWDPEQYRRFSEERSRPFWELIERVGAEPAGSVVDLGCGDGSLTAALAERWSASSVLGIDSSAAMLTSAAKYGGDRVRFTQGDIATFRVDQPVDVMITNAALQWVPAHDQLFASLLAQVAPGGWFAMQVPGNLNDPHHQSIRAVRMRDHWVDKLAYVPERPLVSYTATHYADALATLGCTVDAWETTYVHVLSGTDPVLEWVKGTALRPVLDALSESDAQAFCAELAPLLRAAYPERSWGTPFPFKRVFVVARSGRPDPALA